MTMHAIMQGTLPLLLATVVATSGCFGVDNIQEFKGALGFHEVAVPDPEPPIASAVASTLLARIAERIEFVASGSSDPQGLALLFRWDFGDGASTDGERVSHAYGAHGRYTVTLTVENLAGLVSTDSRTVTILANAAPSAAIAIERNGQPVQEATVGEALRFSALGSSDPENDALRAEWSFGDGEAAEGLEAKHAYAAGGRYAIALTVRDSFGAEDSEEFVLPVQFRNTATGSLDLQEPPATFALPVGADALRVSLALRFDAGLGANDLNLYLYDGNGAEVTRSASSTPIPSRPGSLAGESIALEAPGIREFPSGSWKIVVERVSGTDVAFTLAMGVDY